jgi:hypothetical protein
MSSSSSIKAGSAYIELFTKDSRLVKGLNDAAKRLDTFGKSLQGIGTKMAMLGAGIVAPLAGAAKLFADMGSDMVDMSQRTGVSVEALSELGFAAEQSGADLGTLEGSLKKMQKMLFEAASGSQSAQETLASLGLSVEQLSKLSPDEQFKLIADRMSQITDPTLKTATAMAIFGKSGTQLLPMLSSGAKGIEELQQQARDLGLTMATEDAQAAEAFGDRIDVLWKVLKKIVFTIGSAVEPVLSAMIESTVKLVVMIGDWIKNNKALIVTVFKIGLAIAAGGAAIVALGTAVAGIGAVLGAAATILTGIGTVFTFLVTAIAALISPIGLTIAGLSALVAYFVYTSGAGSRAMQWLGERFGELKDTALAAWQGIGDALAAGDIALAGKILWLTLKMEWHRGVAFLQSKWLDFKGFFIGIFQTAVYSVAGLMTDAWAGLQTGWLETTHFIADSWTILISLLQKGWNRFSGFFQKVWARIQGLFGDTNAEAEIAKINDEIARQDDLINNSQNQTIFDREQQRLKARNKIEQDRLGAQSALGDMQAQEQSALEAANQKTLADSAAELDKAKAEWKAALGKAAAKRAETSPGSPSQFSLSGLDLPSVDGLDQTLAETKKKTDVVGTFNPIAAMNLGADSLGERTARASEEVAANTKKLVQQADRGGLVFG